MQQNALIWSETVDFQVLLSSHDETKKNNMAEWTASDLLSEEPSYFSEALCWRADQRPHRRLQPGI